MINELNNESQNVLEDAVLKYKDAAERQDKYDMELAYKKVIGIYDPFKYYHNWYNQYKYLFDSQEDFLADYTKVFINVLKNWTPRNKRKKSRYDGSGDFKNFFIGSLNHNYINMVKADQAAKRNTTNLCPICNQWVSPLSTHILNDHSDLMWVYLEEMEIDIESLTGCPFCANFKIPKNIQSRMEMTEYIKQHIKSKHTSVLFHRFNDLYPNSPTISPKITSTNIEENNDELDVYDIVEEENGLLNKLYSLNLSPIQQDIITRILNGENNLNYKSSQLECTKEEWDTELEKLRETMSLYGLNK